MKRIFALLAFVLVLNGCDDGDLISQDIDFSNIALQRCGTTNANVLYKLTDRDALILQITNLDLVLPDVPSAPDTFTSVAINGSTVKLLYRVYNGEPVADNICASIQPPTPTVIEEWNATSGTIQIRTSALKTANTAEAFLGGETITALRHAIVIRDVIWQTPNNSITDDIELGYTDETFTTAPALNAIGSDVFKCDTANNPNLVYRISSNNALAININPALLDPTILNTPKTGAITIDGVNSVEYKRYAVGTDLPLLSPDFCTQYNTASLPPTDRWVGAAGDGTTTGIIEVTSTTVGTSVVHSIRLKNMTFIRADGAFSFKLADDYLFGELTVPQ